MLVQLYPCDNQLHQQWAVNATTHSITSRETGLCLDVRYAATADETLVWAYTCNKTGAQIWNVLAAPAPTTTTTVKPTTTTTVRPTTTSIKPTTTSVAKSTTTTTVVPVSNGNLNTKTLCIDVTGLAQLQALESQLGETIHCVETFADSDQCWNEGNSSPCNPYNSWVDPWIDDGDPPDANWVGWMASDPNNRIIVTHDLVPQDVDYNMNDGQYNANWRQSCAAGNYNSYYKTFAANLIKAGFGHAVVRLGHEMNGDWYYDDLGSNPALYGDWAKCFAQGVQSMRSVSGAHFLFDWNVNQGYQQIDFNSYYPGDANVDIIGMDAYDSGMSGNPQSQPARWNTEYNESGGLAQLVAFAKSHNKPVSFPEWGLSTDWAGNGDDAYYPQQMANLVASNNVVYQSYFDPAHDGVPTIQGAPNAWAAYKKAFGPGGSITGRPW